MNRLITTLPLLLTLPCAWLGGCSKADEPPPPASEANTEEATPQEPPKKEPEPAAKREAPQPPQELPPGKPGAAASTGEGDYRPEFAMDGDHSTRWGSNFTDNEWIVFDLGKTEEIAGARIDWETAYGKDYDILVSLDKKQWTQAAAIRDGDGGVDEFFFKPSKARFVKLVGKRRGTGWGYSIWEFQPVKAADLPLLVASSSSKDGPPENALDGDDKTAWKAAAPGPASLTIDFHKVRQVGGIEINWGSPAPAKFNVQSSKDGKAWTDAVRIDETDGGRDLVFFPSATCRMLKIEAEGEGAASISELVFKGSEEELTLARQFEALASRLPDGSLPRWLKRNQTFWTITGVEYDTEETLLGEEGTIEPYRDSFCVMPFLKIDDRIWTPGEFDRTHLLEDGFLPLPTVLMKKDHVEWSVSTVSYGKPGESTTAARYRVSNTGKAPLKVQLNLAVWPLQLNPPWQYGGASPIHKVRLDDKKQMFINDRKAIVPLTAPSAAAVGAAKDGTAFGWIRTGKLPGLTEAKDDQGTASALFRFDLDLAPGESKDVVLLYPQHANSPAEPTKEDPAAYYTKVFEAEKDAWAKQMARWTIDCPEPKLEAFIKSNLAYMLLNRDKAAAQPGPRNYAKAWMRDGAVSTATYVRFGFNDVAREYLDWFTPHIRQDGFAPFLIDTKLGKMPDWTHDWKEYDSQGEYVYAVRKYYDFTKDKEFVNKLFPAIERVMAYQTARLEERRTPKYENTKFYGVLPESNSHEGYFPGVHSYWDDFWAVRGYSDAAYLADVLGKTDKAKAFREQEERFRKDFYASVKKTMELGGKPYIPGCAEKCDFDPTSTSIGLTAANELPHLLTDEKLAKALEHSYNMYVDGLKPRYTGGRWGSFTPYEARNIEALVKLGRREDALRLFEFLIGPSSRPAGWNHLAEVVHYEPLTGSYIGDMPHTWVGADMINAARSFFLSDDGPLIEIAPGVPTAWLESGKKVEVRGLPTTHGELSFKVERQSPQEIVLEASGKAAPPGGFVFRHPFGARVKSATLDGQEIPAGGDGVKFEKLPAKVTLVLGD